MTNCVMPRHLYSMVVLLISFDRAGRGYFAGANYFER